MRLFWGWRKREHGSQAAGGEAGFLEQGRETEEEKLLLYLWEARGKGASWGDGSCGKNICGRRGRRPVSRVIRGMVLFQWVLRLVCAQYLRGLWSGANLQPDSL